MVSTRLHTRIVCVPATNVSQVSYIGVRQVAVGDSPLHEAWPIDNDLPHTRLPYTPESVLRPPFIAVIAMTKGEQMVDLSVMRGPEKVHG